MNILFFILLIALYCVLILAIKYCYDKPNSWQYENKKLRMPTVYDLDNSVKEFPIDKNDFEKHIDKLNSYIKDEIISANNYFLLKNEIKSALSDNSEGIAIALIIRLFSIFLLIQNLKIISSLNTIVCVLIITAFCILAEIIIHIIYKSKLTIPSFVYEEDNNIKDYKDYRNDLSEKDNLNNYLIHNHYRYLSYIRETIKKREFLRKIIIFIASIIYLFFFMTIPKNI